MRQQDADIAARPRARQLQEGMKFVSKKLKTATAKV